MYKRLIITLLAAAMVAAAQDVPRIAWSIDTEDPAEHTLDLVYGETLDLQCTFRNYYDTLDISGATVTIHATTNGMPAGTSYQAVGTAGANGLATVRLDVDAWIPQDLTEVSYTLAVIQTNSVAILRAFGTAYLTGSSASTTNTPIPTSVYSSLVADILAAQTAADAADATEAGLRASADALKLPYTGANKATDTGEFGITTKNLTVSGTVETCPDAMGDEFYDDYSEWLYYDEYQQYRYDYLSYGDYHHIRVYGYIYDGEGDKIFSENYDQYTTYDWMGDSDYSYYIEWSWNTISGVDGYRVFNNYSIDESGDNCSSDWGTEWSDFDGENNTYTYDGDGGGFYWEYAYPAKTVPPVPTEVISGTSTVGENFEIEGGLVVEDNVECDHIIETGTSLSVKLDQTVPQTLTGGTLTMPSLTVTNITAGTLAVSGEATGIEAVSEDGFVIKSQMDAADALKVDVTDLTAGNVAYTPTAPNIATDVQAAILEVETLADTLPYAITAVDGTATVSRANGWTQSLTLDAPTVFDIDDSLTSVVSQVNLSIIAGTNTLMYSSNATNIVDGLADIAVSTNDTTTILFYSAFGKTTWEGSEL